MDDREECRERVGEIFPTATRHDDDDGDDDIYIYIINSWFINTFYWYHKLLRRWKENDNEHDSICWEGGRS